MTQAVSHLLLGRDHETYGAHHVLPVSATTACAISAGGDEAFAEELAKTHVNEDAVLVVETERHTLLCVADAHFGREASEHVLVALRAALTTIPENAQQLAAIFDELARTRWKVKYSSETTLAICIYDRLFRQAFGLSFGDSTVTRVTAGRPAARANERTNAFVSLARPRSVRPRGARHFAFSPGPDELIVVFTDGVDECCYREPERGVSPVHLGHALTPVLDDPRAAADTLTRLALAGVDGHPGGQDNIAVCVTRT